MKAVEVVAGIIKFNDKILCTQRDISKNPEVSFQWEFPGGKIEAGESHQTALTREIKEELDMEVVVEDFFMEINYSYPMFNLKMYTYLCSTTTDTLKLNVHKDYKWLKNTQLHTLDWAPADAPIVKKLISLSNI